MQSSHILPEKCYNCDRDPKELVFNGHVKDVKMLLLYIATYRPPSDVQSTIRKRNNFLTYEMPYKTLTSSDPGNLFFYHMCGPPRNIREDC